MINDLSEFGVVNVDVTLVTDPFVTQTPDNRNVTRARVMTSREVTT